MANSEDSSSTSPASTPPAPAMAAPTPPEPTMAAPTPPAPAMAASTPPAPRVPEDIANGLRFTHVLEVETKQRVAELSASFYALVETLITRGQLPIDEYERRRQQTMHREVERASKEMGVLVDGTPDKYKLDKLPEIDCEARLPLCRARCCTLVFALSVQDLDERVVRWDYSRPYQIGRRSDGYCVHNKPGTCHCEVYQNRPSVCRTYDCRNDKRIWVDFDKRVPAE